MTDLERDASALVRDIIDACAAVAGMDDITLACKVDQAPFKARIVALARECHLQQSDPPTFVPTYTTALHNRPYREHSPL